MDIESFLDVTYLLNPDIVSSIKSVDSVAVFGSGAPLELPLAMFQVLMAFADKRTTRQAFHMLDVDVSIEDFGKITKDFLEHGLLKPEMPLEDGPGLRQVLEHRSFDNPTLINQLSYAMQQGRAIVIPNALPEDLAERVHGELDHSSRWSVSEGGHDFFHHRNSFIDKLDTCDGALAECSRLFRSSTTRRFVSEISGQDCTGEAHIAAAWYRPGEYALPHDDSTMRSPRSVAYIWYLTKDWRQEWGGALFWCPTGQYIRPCFNMLVLFNVTPSNMHLVCPVAPIATGKRLTINGFWNQAEQRPSSPPIPTDMWISPSAYGTLVQEHAELLPVIVL